jgi:hypothetical protein
MKSLRAILAVFQVTRRRIVNSRAFAWMLIAVLAASGGMPFTLRGDGSTGSLLKLAVIYPPALMFGILLVGTLWSAAALNAQDIDSGAFSAIVVKPTPQSSVWLGKWFGLLALNAVLLAAAGVALRTAVAIRDQEESPVPATRVLDGHAEFLPDDTALRDEAAGRQILMRLTGQPSPDFNHLLNHLKTEAFRIQPGQRYTWTIPVADTPSGATLKDWSLQFRFHCDALERRPISGTWTIRTENGDEQHIPTSALLDGLHLAVLPPAAYHGTLSVSFANHKDSAATAFFNPLTPVTLLRRDHSFSVNLLRAFLLLFFFLAAAAALALSLGALFSFPVAVFTAIALLLAVMLAHAFAAIPPPGHSHGEPDLTATAISQAGEWMLGHLHHATSRTLRLMPLSQLADSRAISGAQIAQAAFSLLAAIPAILCLLSSLHLQRREYPS